MISLFYEDEWVRLYLGNSFSAQAAMLLDREPIDHGIADPPYDAETHEGAHSELRPNYGVKFPPIFPQQVASILRPRRWAVVFCSLEMLGDYRRSVGDRWVRSGYWDRVDGAPQLTGDRPAQPGEGLAIWHGSVDGKMRWNGGGKKAVWRFPRVKNAERVHETQKPEPLMRALVQDFSEPGELIADPFAGSGTTGVAAKRCGRRAILIEIEEERCVQAAERLKRTEVDERLVMAPVPRSRQQKLGLEV